MAAARAGPRAAGRRVGAAAPRTAAVRAAAPGRGLPVRLLPPVAGQAAPLAPGRRRRARRTPRRRPTSSWRPTGGWPAASRRTRTGWPGTPAGCATCGGCWWPPGPGRRRTAASVCTSGPWSTGWTPTRCATGRLPLRLGSAGTDAVVEQGPLRCTHIDAYRFFTAGRGAAQRVPPDPGQPARARAAGLPARGHGPVQVGGGLRPVPAGRAGGRLLRARPRDPGPRHAGLAVRPGRRSATRRSRSRPPRGGPSTSAGSAPSPSPAPPCGTAWSPPSTSWRPWPEAPADTTTAGPAEGTGRRGAGRA